MKTTNYTKLALMDICLQLFDGNTNVTADTGLSDEMKTFYGDTLIDMAEPKLVHDQFGQKKPIPQNGGKTIEFRKYDPLPKALTPLTEGVTPNGQKLTMSTITASVAQYGGYVELSDILLLTAIDNNLVEATKLLGGQAGRTLDTITREVMAGGTNIQYAEGQVSSRYALYYTIASDNCNLTVDAVRRAARYLKKMNAEKIGGDYVGIIHTDCEFDLMSDPDWKYPHQYVDTTNLYEGEIGKIAGVRFVETSEAKKIVADNLTAASRNLTVKTTLGAPGTTVAVDEAITAGEATALAGRKIILNGNQYTIASAASGAAGSATITTTGNVTVADGTDGNVVYPGEAGAAGRDIYATLIIGANAYGITEISGGGLQHIVKQLGSAGTADPLNQRATAGWKAIKTAERLVEAYMVRVETTSTFNDHEEN